MKATYLIVTGLSLWLTSLRSPAQEAPPPAPPMPKSTPAPVALTGTAGPVSCAYCDLRGKDLAGKNLTNANLVGSNLREAKLAGATLDGAVLVGANLADADLSGAHLTPTSNGPADLTNANLAGASFREAVLTGAQLLFAGLEGADFSGADLTGAVLGPRPKLGTKGGRRTSFHGARMDRRAAPGAAAADLSGVIWNEPKAAATTPGPAGVTCGGFKLSGVTNPVYVSTQGTDSASCGASPTTACKTFARALSRCTPTSCDVLAMFGAYALPATLAFDSQSTPAGARLYGGCVASGQADTGLSSEISAPPGGVPAVSIKVAKPVVLENFKILGSTAAGSNAAPAVTVQIAQAPQVTLSNSMVVGGKGGTGAGGANQPAGVQGGAAGNLWYAGTNPSCGDSNGGNGFYGEVPYGYRDPDCGIDPSQYNGQSGYPGDTSRSAPGGGAGTPFAAFCPPKTPNDGGGGTGGDSAGCGTGGRSSTDVAGGFAGATWSPGAGGMGTRGGNAGGGGGGGGGGAYCTLCFGFPRWYPGSFGGGGGAGGCGGQAAPGGQQGGASFGIVAAAGSVLTVKQSRVVAGRSGDGGKGGVGGNGGPGGGHGAGAGTSGYGYHGGKGGDGGDGGIGGGGGGGAGGNGGPSAALVLVGGATVGGTGNVYYVGSSGTFGGGGAGGTSTVCPTGPGGTSGVLGTAAETLIYP